MGKQEDLDKLTLAIKDAENRSKNFRANVETIQKEINFLLTLERQLEENIAYLKNIKVVALAMEYKKAKEDLKKTKIKLLQLKSDLSINQKSEKELENLTKKNKELYDKLSKQNSNNVLQGKFNKRNV